MRGAGGQHVLSWSGLKGKPTFAEDPAEPLGQTARHSGMCEHNLACRHPPENVLQLSMHHT